jgi:hypothetical protein
VGSCTLKDECRYRLHCINKTYVKRQPGTFFTQPIFTCVFTFAIMRLSSDRDCELRGADFSENDTLVLISARSVTILKFSHHVLSYVNIKEFCCNFDDSRCKNMNNNKPRSLSPRRSLKKWRRSIIRQLPTQLLSKFLNTGPNSWVVWPWNVENEIKFFEPQLVKFSKIDSSWDNCRYYLTDKI